MLRDQKVFKMAFQVVFSAKKCAKIQFRALGCPKTEQTRGAKMVPLGNKVFPEPGWNWVNF